MSNLEFRAGEGEVSSSLGAEFELLEQLSLKFRPSWARRPRKRVSLQTEVVGEPGEKTGMGWLSRCVTSAATQDTLLS